MANKSAKFHREHILIVEDGKERREIILTAADYSLGRAQDCDIRLYSQFISRYHATLLRCNNDDGMALYRIVDGDLQGNLSANGLMVNGRKLMTRDLQHGDEVVLGPQVFLIYQYRQRNRFPTMPTDDPFDITLIDPSMMVPAEEQDEPGDITTPFESE